MIKVSESAKQKVVALMREEGFDALSDYVRVGVKSGGCSGLSYELKFDRDLDESDKVFEDNAIRIIVDKKKLPLPGRYYPGILRGPQWKRICFQ